MVQIIDPRSNIIGSFYVLVNNIKHILIQFLQYIHVTPNTESGILSGFQNLLQNFSETCSV